MQVWPTHSIALTWGDMSPIQVWPTHSVALTWGELSLDRAAGKVNPTHPYGIQHAVMRHLPSGSFIMLPFASHCSTPVHVLLAL